MKNLLKLSFIALALASFTLTSCGSNDESSENTDTEMTEDNFNSMEEEAPMMDESSEMPMDDSTMEEGAETDQNMEETTDAAE